MIIEVSFTVITIYATTICFFGKLQSTIDINMGATYTDSEKKWI
jgi:hypothetical protein